jgi:glucose-1-phosphate thymidylyltransferase
VINIAKGVRPTWRPETDIVEIHKAYLAMNELDVRLVHGRWLDAGTFDSLLQAANFAAAREFQKKLGYDDKMFIK